MKAETKSRKKLNRGEEMNKVLKIFDKYSFCVWAIVILLVAAVILIPFTPGSVSVFGLTLPITPMLVLFPMLMGIFYAFIVSCEEPKISKKRKNVLRTLKLIDFVVFYALTISVIVYAAAKGMIRF